MNRLCISAGNPGAARRGVVLMIMLSLLALFTVIAVTFVVASGQFRRGAAIAARVEQSGDSWEVLLQQGLMQVVRGSNHPHSVMGPHSLLEDIYGDSDSVTGVLTEIIQEVDPTDQEWVLTDGANMFLMFAAATFGHDKLPGVALVDDDGNGVVDDITESMISGSTSGDDCFLGQMPPHPSLGLPPQPIDNVDNYYAGRVITFVSGPAAGQSCYIIRSKYREDPAEFDETTLYITPPTNGKVPAPGSGDRFVINGRPFSGTGFGATRFQYDANGTVTGPKPSTVEFTIGQTPGVTVQVPNPNLRRLDRPYTTFPQAEGPGFKLHGMLPIAYTPNPVDAGYRQYLTTEMVDADEDYDAPDLQNMILAHQQWNPALERWMTVAPSLHRPDLINYLLMNPLINPKSNETEYNEPYRGVDRPRWTKLPPAVRRRVILRPDPVDHFDYTQEGVLDPINSDGWTPGEPFVDGNFNNQYDPGEDFKDLNGDKVYDIGDQAYANTGIDLLNGPWDVDNDGDNVPDSIWVDLGAPVMTGPDGKLIKVLYAPLVIDLDGRINVNAHGTHKHYDFVQAEVAAIVSNTNTGAYQSGSRTRPDNSGSSTHGPNPTFYTSEERSLMGPYASASRQRASNIRQSTTVTEQIFGTGLFADAPSEIFGASGYNNHPGLYSVTGQNDPIGGRNVPRLEPAVGQGESVADVNLGPIVGGSRLSQGGTSVHPFPDRINSYRRLLEGFFYRPDHLEAQLDEAMVVSLTSYCMPIPGRYGEQHLTRVTPRYLSGVGIVPRAGASDISAEPSAYPNSAPSRPGDDNTPMSIGSDNNNALGNTFRNAYEVLKQTHGDYGTPGDPNSNGAVILDLAGHPIYAAMGTPKETVDEPTEINLNRRYYPVMRLSGKTTQGGAGDRAYLDAPFTPAEMERLLRYHDPSAEGLSDRLQLSIGDDWHRQHAMTTESWDIPCPHIAPTPELSKALTDLGLPVTNPSLGDLLRARFYVAHGAYAPTTPTRISAARATDLATWAMRMNPVRRLLSPDLGQGLRMDINAPFGNGKDDNEPNEPPAQIDDGTPPGDNGVRELTDNPPNIDGNGIVDEPGEFSQAGESLWGGTLRFDGNRDGAVDPNNGLAARQQYAKELYCLMLLLLDENYVMPVPQVLTSAPGVTPWTTEPETIAPSKLGGMPALASGLFPGIREGLWNNSDPNIMPVVERETLDEMKARRWLTARRLAQWAINAVDFRDRDSIMTPFEFDVDPFNDNDSSTGTTWDVDGNLTSNESAGATSTGNWFRGVVWGCEYSDLLLTETLAFHDRRTANTMYDNGTVVTTGTLTFKLAQSTPGGNPILFDTTVTPTVAIDRNWDQTRVPKGGAFIEVFATGNQNNRVFPGELYDVTTVTDPENGTIVDVVGTLDLARKAGNSPVWRLAVTQGRVEGVSGTNLGIAHPANDVAARLAKNRATCSLDPADAGLSILPWVNAAVTGTGVMQFERVVSFCRLTGGEIGALRAGLNTPATAIDVYGRPDHPATTATSGVIGKIGGVFNPAQPDPEPALPDPSVRRDIVPLFPGSYAVVGPHRESGPTSGTAAVFDVTSIGSTLTQGLAITTTTDGMGTVTSQTVSVINNQAKHSVIALHQGQFVASTVGGNNDFPIHNELHDAANRLTGLVTGNVSPSNQISDQIRPPLAVSCALFGDDHVGFNISEPNQNTQGNFGRGNRNAIYPTANLATWNDPWNGNVTYPEDELNFTGTTTRYDDEPWDGDMTSNSAGGTVIKNPHLDRIDDHTALLYKSVFLQRLADPTKIHDPVTNPYITMDWMPFDLTVFNGEPWWFAPAGPDRDEQLAMMKLEHFREAGNVSRPAAGTSLVDDKRVRFGSRQRGAPRYPHRGEVSHMNLWGQPDWLDFSYGGDTRPPRTGRASDGSAEGTLQLGEYDIIDGALPAVAPSTTPRYTSECRVKWQDPLQHTLGYLNRGYHYVRNFPSFTPSNYDASVVNEPFVRPGRTTSVTGSEPLCWLMEADFEPPVWPPQPPKQRLPPTGALRPLDEQFQYLGAPWRPFNWLTWNNRPYASAMELMLVPASSPGRLLFEYDMRRASIDSAVAPEEPSRSGNHYLPYVSLDGVPGYAVRPPFGHLLNFFESSPAAPASPDAVAASDPQQHLAVPGALPFVPLLNDPSGTLEVKQTYSAANYYRLFEFVHVPSRFSGTRQMHGNPNTNSAGKPASASAWPFLAPFNSISAYREPGRVNLNTIPLMATPSNKANITGQAGVWRAVTNDFHPRGAGGGYVNASDVLFDGGSNSLATTLRTPSQSTPDNFFSLLASMHSDDKEYDPRGLDQDAAASPDFNTLSWLPDARCDQRFPNLLKNPIRSYLEDYSAVTPALRNPNDPKKDIESFISTSLIPPDKGLANPFLAIDSTLLRRRDTRWSPWDLGVYSWPRINPQGLNFPQLRTQFDPAFDPLFALNFPRPTGENVQTVQVPLSGYVTNMLTSGAARESDYRNTDRSPFFRYQMYTKLSNIATTRSNVYAIWMTVGFFEVEKVEQDPTKPNAALPSQETTGYSSGNDQPVQYRFPDGYRIVREAGSETGEVVRHKAFAIFDRTIPVGFLRGENLNVDQGFLLRRICY